MKNHIFAFISLVLICAACFDDIAIQNELEDLRGRVTSLENWQIKTNANLSVLNDIAQALQDNDYVTDIQEIKNHTGSIIGYSINFARSGSKIIYVSTDEADAKTPGIGIKLDYDGRYYWTYDDTWLLDAHGNRIPASGLDGKDGVTPTLKIENGAWYVSYNEGKEWSRLEDVQNSNSACIFKEVKIIDGYAVFVMADGTSHALLMRSELSISFSCNEEMIIQLNSAFDIGYEIFSSKKDANIEIISSADVIAEVIKDSTNPLKGKIRVTVGDSLSAQSKVVVLVADGYKVIMKSIRFEREVLTIADNAVKNVGVEGGEISLEVLSNVDFEASISTEAASWISPVTSKGVTSSTLTFNISKNSGKMRTGTISLKSVCSGYTISYTIVQNGWPSVYLPKGNGVMPCSGTLYVNHETTSANSGIGKMVDNDNNTSYKANVSEITILWEGDQSVQISALDVYFTNNTSLAPQEISLKGSQDKVRWDSIVKATSESLYKWTYNYTNNTAYKYFQITVRCNKSNPDFEIKELHLLPISTGEDDNTDNFGFANFSDVEKRGSYFTNSSSTPMGNHYANKHVTTSADKQWLGTSSNEPNLLPSAPSYTWRNYSVNLYPFGTPVPADVNQHGIGDCSALAVFASMAYLFPDFIKSIITDNGDGTYIVKMFDPQGKPIEVALQSTFLGTSSSIGAVSGKKGEPTWATVLEKAIMKWNYIYKVNPDIQGIGSEHVAPLFTGTGNSFAFYPKVLNANEMKRVAELSLEEKMIVIGGFNTGGLYVDSGQTVTAHAYSFMLSSNENALFAMRNPWGHSPGTNGEEDGILNIVNDGIVPPTIDMRIIYPGIAKQYAKKTLEPYSPPTSSN